MKKVALFRRASLKRYGVVLADPPWQFTSRAKKGENKIVPARGAQPYKTMSLDELKALDVEAVAAKDCMLIMWVVEAHVPEALELGKAWGFTYKTSAFTWRKIVRVGTNGVRTAPLEPEERSARMGMGYWTRKQTERCLLFTRGRPKRLDAGVPEIIDAEIREHSRKPDEIYGLIERLVGGPYLELFSRTARPGWTAWGDETGKFDTAPEGCPACRDGVPTHEMTELPCEKCLAGSQQLETDQIDLDPREQDRALWGVEIARRNREETKPKRRRSLAEMLG